MQVSAAISFVAAAVAVVAADSFTAEDQAVWVDRHNYFRTTGLPWSAGDMRRIGWSSDLATTAAATAAKCSATTAAGVNAYQSAASNSSAVVDEAIQQWVVETSMTTLKTLAQPGASGVDVGTGTYNAYSQVLWAATTSVGCARASCSGGDLVVCEYSPAGNDGSSAWYVHADTASDCPSGTTAQTGLCLVEGDAANNQIAPIPAGKLTYEVYPAYVVDMQTVLIEAARAIANGAASNSTGSTTQATTAKPTATTAAPTSTTATPTATTAAPTSSSKETPSSKGTPSSKKDSSAATKTDSSKKTTASSSSDTSSSAKSSTDSSADSSTKQSSQTTASNSDESAPGTVKASSDNGSTFTNQETSTTTGSSTQQTSGSTSATNSANTESKTASTATSSASGATSINNQSSSKSGGGISAAGLAGMIVLAIVGIAAFGVVMSYKRNQQRQREIMRDGGIRII
ncbi:hypothetical protein PHYPSEUDO_002514 [Phytophthora pseudosyringae]|uniref:SCP domain-containing protein n=1 Tax=Phytophthora pseudosyringae TaxID=221518 RepID=A0A8T1VUA6_9STRA|nr:hypothetical protein PHYPSEUDO_002514 [Phytophthora pseudosyringae]